MKTACKIIIIKCSNVYAFGGCFYLFQGTHFISLYLGIQPMALVFKQHTLLSYRNMNKMMKKAF